MLEQFQSERLLQGNRQIKAGDGWEFMPNKPATINRLLATLKHMINKGYQWEMCSEETMKRVSQVKMLKENNKRLRYLNSDESIELINNCKDVTRSIVITALNTGMRKGEILSLTWDCIDMKHGFILLDMTKNGERREIPINDDLRAVFTNITRRIDVPYVFYDKNTGKPYQDIKRSFATACKNSGIWDFHFHDLRHTFASRLVMKGADIVKVSKLLGHKSLTMTLRYSHLAPNDLQNAVNMLNFTGEEKRTAYLLHSQQGNQ